MIFKSAIELVGTAKAHGLCARFPTVAILTIAFVSEKNDSRLTNVVLFAREYSKYTM